MGLVGSVSVRLKILICTLISVSSGIVLISTTSVRTPGRLLRRTVSNSQSQILGSLFFLLEPVGLILIDQMVQKILITVLLRSLSRQMTSRLVPTLGFTMEMIQISSLRSAPAIKGLVGRHRRAKSLLVLQGMLVAASLVLAVQLAFRRLVRRLHHDR